jgi:hypothetical protein
VLKTNGSQGILNQPALPSIYRGLFSLPKLPLLHRAYPLQRGEMDQLLGFRSDGHILHTKLLRINAPSAITPRAATASLQNRHLRVLRPKLSKTRHRSGVWF